MNKCVWTEDRGGWYVSDCEQVFEFDSEIPLTVRFRFCPYCGRRIEEKKFKYPEERKESFEA